MGELRFSRSNLDILCPRQTHNRMRGTFLYWCALFFPGVLAQNATSRPATADDVESCLNKMVLRVRALNGPFFTQKQSMMIAEKAYEMYLVQKMSPEQIADYFYYNYANLDLTPEQCQTLTDIYAAVVQIMDSSANKTDTLFYNGVEAALDAVQRDKAEADAMIARMEAQGHALADIELALCRFTIPRINPERKRQIVLSVAQMIPPEKRLAIRDQLRKVVRIEDYHVNATTATIPVTLGNDEQ